jgi:hypothetical protein
MRLCVYASSTTTTAAENIKSQEFFYAFAKKER